MDSEKQLDGSSTVKRGTKRELESEVSSVSIAKNNDVVDGTSQKKVKLTGTTCSSNEQVATSSVRSANQLDRPVSCSEIDIGSKLNLVGRRVEVLWGEEDRLLKTSKEHWWGCTVIRKTSEFHSGERLREEYVRIVKDDKQSENKSNAQASNKEGTSGRAAGREAAADLSELKLIKLPVYEVCYDVDPKERLKPEDLKKEGERSRVCFMSDHGLFDINYDSPMVWRYEDSEWCINLPESSIPNVEKCTEEMIELVLKSALTKHMPMMKRLPRDQLCMISDMIQKGRDKLKAALVTRWQAVTAAGKSLSAEDIKEVCAVVNVPRFDSSSSST
mmetsp:Transcript_14552/g.17467  ORF Transcript_14552/g.17467 Transcript_14552/m.17467 type:complete len:331 (+) Transcript_14552:2-994(+)